jgi:hypothetical protein
MVAGRLLDVNSLDGKPGVSEEHVASLQQHLAEAIGLLPQLCTGVDVNPRLHDIRGFEYTRETVRHPLPPASNKRPAWLAWLLRIGDLRPARRACGQPDGRNVPTGPSCS